MFGSAKQGAHAYATVGIETGVLVASPHKLIAMLFDGALLAVALGLQHMTAGDIEKKGMAISRAIAIVDGGLRASLDRHAGGTIADNLDALYRYISTSLLAANIDNDQALLADMHALLTELRSAWNAIASVDAPVTMTSANPTANKTESAAAALRLAGI